MDDAAVDVFVVPAPAAVTALRGTIQLLGEGGQEGGRDEDENATTVAGKRPRDSLEENWFFTLMLLSSLMSLNSSGFDPMKLSCLMSFLGSVPCRRGRGSACTAGTVAFTALVAVRVRASRSASD